MTNNDLQNITQKKKYIFARSHNSLVHFNHL